MSRCLLILVYAATLSYAQSTMESQQFGRSGFEVGGAHLYSVSLFSGYSTSASAANAAGPSGSLGTLGSLSTQPGVGPDANYGISAVAGWQHHADRMDATVMYSGTYLRMAQYTTLDSFNQTLNASLMRKLSNKWSLSMSITAADISTAQFLFQASPDGVATGLASNINDLAAAYSVGQFSSSQVASLLTGALSLQNPGRSLILGDRLLSASGQMAIHYAVTPRLAITIGGLTTEAQRLLQGGQSSSQDALIPHSSGANGTVGFSYSLSPRTDLGVNGGVNWITNRFESAYVGNGSLSLGRKMGEHWFLRLQAGASDSRIKTASAGPAIGSTTQATGGGTLGFRTYRNSLAATYTRSTSDTFGIAVGTATSIGGAWTFHNPTSRWTLTNSFQQQELRNAGFVSLSGWTASSSFYRQMGFHTNLNLQYSYLSARGSTSGQTSDNSYQSVRLSAGWSPLPQR